MHPRFVAEGCLLFSAGILKKRKLNPSNAGGVYDRVALKQKNKKQRKDRERERANTGELLRRRNSTEQCRKF